MDEEKKERARKMVTVYSKRDREFKSYAADPEKATFVESVKEAFNTQDIDHAYEVAEARKRAGFGKGMHGK